MEKERQKKITNPYQSRLFFVKLTLCTILHCSSESRCRSSLMASHTKLGDPYVSTESEPFSLVGFPVGDDVLVMTRKSCGQSG
jgi:hypothetical protein